MSRTCKDGCLPKLPATVVHTTTGTYHVVYCCKCGTAMQSKPPLPNRLHRSTGK